MSKITPKQKKFVDEYLIDLNQTRAYKKAYPNVKKDSTACVCASQLLKKPNIQEYLQKKQKKLQERTEITQERVLKELAAVAFSKASDYAKVVEKQAMKVVNGVAVDVYDENGEPILYRDVELELTENLTEQQKRAIAVMKKGRDGYEVKTYDKIKALELIGKHIGMFDSRNQNDDEALKKLDDVLDKIGGVI